MCVCEIVSSSYIMPKMRLEAASEACMCPGGIYTDKEFSRSSSEKEAKYSERPSPHCTTVLCTTVYMLQQENSRATDEGPLIKRTRLVSHKARAFFASQPKTPKGIFWTFYS